MDPFSANALGTLGAGVVSGVLGGLGGLFGRRRRGPNPNQVGLNQSMDRLNQVRQNYGNMYNSAASTYNRYNPQYTQAVDDAVRYYRNDPNTDSARSRYISQATAGTTGAYQGAKAALAAEMARRGLSGSSVDVGGLASLEGARAADMGRAANAWAQEALTRRESNLQNLLNLLGSVRSDERSTMASALGAQGSIDQNQASMYANLLQNDQARAAQQQNALFGLLGELGGAAGNIIGRGRGSTPGDLLDTAEVQYNAPTTPLGMYTAQPMGFRRMG